MRQPRMLSIFTAGCVFAAICMIAAGQDEVSAPGVSGIPSTRFDHHCVVRAQIQNLTDLAIMNRISPDVWSESVGIGPVDFRVPPDQMDELDASGIEYEVLIANVQALIDSERARLLQDDPAWFDNYHPRAEVNNYLDSLAAARPDLAEVFQIGESHQGRPIMAIHITGASGPDDKDGVLLNGCQHAREWIAVMTTMFIADQLVSAYDSNPKIRDLVDRLDFYIVPISNPDGYDYTWSNNRLWRKNRRPGGGVDLNRNWGFGWGGPGSSGDPASETYRGTAPFSEPETQAMRDFAIDHPNILYHNDIHSYSQLVLQPWGWTRKLPPDHDVLDATGEAMVVAIAQTHGMTYRHGPIFTTIYPASGNMCDWMYGDRNALSISYELRDRGQYGFLLPADQIVPTGEEALAGILEEVGAPMPRKLTLDLMEPARWGGTLHLRTSRATPGQRVYFFYSLTGVNNPPGTPVPPLDLTLDLWKARLLEYGVADDAGIVEVQRPLPSYNRQMRIFLQSAEFSRLTRWISYDIPAG